VPGRQAPKSLSVGTPTPSPMASTMSMTLGLPRAMTATVDVLDSQGRLVRRLCEGERPAGWVTFSWDARGAGGHETAPGVYFVRVQTPDGGRVRRLVRIP
jgi:flagellar hook assembly protein FlgD